MFGKKDKAEGTRPAGAGNDRSPAASDGNVTTRLAPRPIDRPSVDPASRKAFGRPAGFNGSFLGSDKHRDQGEFTPRNAPPDPVLAEAFSRPDRGGESLQRHPIDAGALDAKRDGEADATADPWRNPGAAASLTRPALPQPQPVKVSSVTGKLGVREVLFGGKVSYRALAVLLGIALVLGVVGGWVGRKTAEVVEAFTTSKVTLETSGTQPPEGRFAQVAASVADSVVTVEAKSDEEGSQGSGVVIDDGLHRHEQPRDLDGGQRQRAKLEVVFSDGTRVPARIVGRDIRRPTSRCSRSTTSTTSPSRSSATRTSCRSAKRWLPLGAPLGLDRTVTQRDRQRDRSRCTAASGRDVRHRRGHRRHPDRRRDQPR